MKVLLGGIAAITLGTVVGVCPEHLRAKAGETLQVPDEARAELARQMDVFLDAMRPETPDFSDSEKAVVTEL